jgi:CheY-like chemotaxis protein
VADSITVLVVDDEHLAHPMYEDILAEGGFTVAIAPDAAKAIEMLEADGAAYSALVTDINLGSKLTGWDVATRAREITADIPVVYMTGFAEADWTAYGVPKSVMIAKPFAPAQLLTAVAQLLNSASG